MSPFQSATDGKNAARYENYDWSGSCRQAGASETVAVVGVD
jgi:hypothetical protein